MRSPTVSLPAPVIEAVRALDASARPDRASWLGEGYGAAAYRVPSPFGDWAVRLPKPRSPWALGDLEREVRLLELIERAPLAVIVPRDATLLRDAAGGSIGTAHRLVPGEPLAQHPVHGRVERERLAGDIARFLSTLHAIPVREATRHGARERDLWRDEYAPLIEEVLPQLRPRSREWLRGVADEFVAAGASSNAPRVLVHGDLSGHHLLMDEEGALTGVIDFADALIVDPAIDFAGILNDFPWPFLERVWRRYAGVLDEGVRQRVRFYIAVAPIYRVVHGALGRGPEERIAGMRQIAARAAAAGAQGTRQGTRTPR